MSTITRERAELKSFITGFLTDPMHDDQSSSSMTAEVFRIALASLEAEPVAWDYEWASCITCEGPQDFKLIIEHEAPPEWAIHEGQARNLIPLYAAPPAPVMPDEAINRAVDEIMASYAGSADECRKLVRKHIEDACRAAMLQGAEPVTTANKLPEETGSSLQLRNLIRQRHAEWSRVTFGDVGPVGPLKHLSKEAIEAAAEPDDLSEWADMQFLLWDAQRRAGISDGEITAAMEEKLKVNMARQWPEPKDGEPRLHIKAAPRQEV